MAVKVSETTRLVTGTFEEVLRECHLQLADDYFVDEQRRLEERKKLLEEAKSRIPSLLKFWERKLELEDELSKL